MRASLLVALAIAGPATALPGLFSWNWRRNVDTQELPATAPEGWPKDIHYPPTPSDLHIPMPKEDLVCTDCWFADQASDNGPSVPHQADQSQVSKRDSEDALKKRPVDYVNCFPEETGSHVLNGSRFDGKEMSGSRCFKMCAGYTYFGMGDGTTCYCGNSIHTTYETSIQKHACNIPCPGDKKQTCGGQNVTSVWKYQKPLHDLHQPSSSLSIYPTAYPTADSTFAERDEEKGKPKSKSSSKRSSATLLKSASATSSLQLREFPATPCTPVTYIPMPYNSRLPLVHPKASQIKDIGPHKLHSAEQTFDPNKPHTAIMPTKTHAIREPSSDCSDDKTKDRRQFVDQGVGYQGCYTDDAVTRLLNGMNFVSLVMSNTECSRLCNSFNYYGTENGVECYCGNEVNIIWPNLLGDLACKVPCAGNPGTWCGGPLHMSLFRNQNSAPPAPQPSSSEQPSSVPMSTLSTSTTSEGPSTIWLTSSSTDSSASPTSVLTVTPITPTSSSATSTDSSSDTSIVMTITHPASSSEPSSTSSSSTEAPDSSSSSTEEPEPTFTNEPTSTSSVGPTGTAFVPYYPHYVCGTFEDKFDLTYSHSLSGEGLWNGQSPVNNSATGVLAYPGFSYISDSFHQTLLPPPSLPNAIGTGSKIFKAGPAAIMGKNATTWFGLASAYMACGTNTGIFLGSVESCKFQVTGTRADGSVVSQTFTYHAMPAKNGYRKAHFDANLFYALRRVDIVLLEASRPLDQVMLLVDNVKYGACYMEDSPTTSTGIDH